MSGVFVIFRSPYERLVSAYKDKVLSRDAVYIHQWRRPCHWLSLTNRVPTISFQQFVSCIIGEYRNASTVRGLNVFNGYSLDLHWTPQFSSALPCSFEYTLIGNYSHFSADLSAMLNLFDLEMGSLDQVNKKPSNRSLSSWYRELDGEAILALQEYYYYDFEIFGFNKQPP